MTMTSRVIAGLLVVAGALALLSILSLTFATGGEGATIVVDDDPGPWRNHSLIQSAIESASPGDTVRVFSGHYLENIEVTKRLALQGNGSADTIIEGNGTGNVVRLAADGVTLSGFEVRNGGDAGAGVRIDSGSKPYPPGTRNNVVEDNVICENSGHGIQVNVSDFHELRQNTIRDNGMSGIDLERSGGISIEDNVILNNTVGIRLFRSDVNWIRRNDINESRNIGIYFQQDADGSEVTNNTIAYSTYYGVCFLTDSNGNDVYHNDFIDNGEGGSQGYDSQNSSTNDWFSDWGGNRWSDYDGLDEDRDGIGDTWYQVDGEGNRSDRKPLVDVPNMPPSAAILSISPYPSHLGQEVTFEGNGSDDDGNVTLFVWTSDVDGEFYNGSSNTTTFFGLSEGEHNITLRVRDDMGAWSEPAMTTFKVGPDPNATNARPTANILQVGPDPASSEEEVSFVGTGGDEDGDVRRVYWNSSVDGVLHSGPPGWSFDMALSPGLHNVSLAVRDDDHAWSRADWAFIAIYNGTYWSNEWPVADVESVGPDPVRLGDNVTFVADASDPDGAVMRY
ncbi:MAG: right-handed parallel beta-helix repeat-containing protein, partial [Thermoplasmata archaeon]|nr:right-handed parallel beta-helix repeat-containing protein [Thermoplasmata archaeon]